MIEPTPASPRAPDTGDTLRLLEAFVVDNEDLVQLEERIGRFNIFDALGIVRSEIRHSNFLAWLLDPAESHGTGQLFLRAVLMDILHQAPAALRPLSPVELDGLDLAGVEIRREQDHIDILIAADNPKIVVAIENKIDSGEHSNQLGRYREAVAKRYPDHKPLFVFLTREGDEPSEEEWSPYSYADLHTALSRARRLNNNAIGDDVLVFLDQYLSMIASRFMDDPKIEELCNRIYRNHRQALDLIFERRSDPRTTLCEAFIERITSLGEYNIHRFPKGVWCEFVPTEWLSILPAIGTKRDPRMWIKPQFGGGPRLNKMWAEIWIDQTTDPAESDRVVQLIRNQGTSCGLTVIHRRRDGGEYVHKAVVIHESNGYVADEASVQKVRAAAEEHHKMLLGLTALLRQLFA